MCLYLSDDVSPRGCAGRLCKRYDLKLEEAMRTCPICLENVTHSIQLSCGKHP
jgi:hypothetical protein